MKTIKSYFAIDSQYKEMVSKYTNVDGIATIIYFTLLMGAYYFMGVIYDTKNLYLGNQINIVLSVICIIYVLFRGQKLSSIGFSKKNLGKSLIMGLVAGGIVLTIQLLPGIIGGRQFNPVSKLMSSFIYYLIIIGLTEEIIFRGFIQTRIYGIVKKPIIAILLTAFLFMIMHIPFQMGAAHMGFFEYISNNFVTLIFTFGWHLVFNFMYSKYNSIVGPTVFHAIMNWSNYLFL
ncbi:MAG: CPBP family intramembrane glutamic endopeptidase [Tissierellales bacterium]